MGAEFSKVTQWFDEDSAEENILTEQTYYETARDAVSTPKASNLSKQKWKRLVDPRSPTEGIDRSPIYVLCSGSNFETPKVNNKDNLDHQILKEQSIAHLSVTERYLETDLDAVVDFDDKSQHLDELLLICKPEDANDNGNINSIAKSTKTENAIDENPNVKIWTENSGETSAVSHETISLSDTNSKSAQIQKKTNETPRTPLGLISNRLNCTTPKREKSLINLKSNSRLWQAPNDFKNLIRSSNENNTNDDDIDKSDCTNIDYSAFPERTQSAPNHKISKRRNKLNYRKLDHVI